ncbi:MAG TPA: serine hydrolase domain-containing protein [Gaiellaceae bacterium]|nr:serine hydrolase domain-containing protein [Gaiellaceae bacterium]
MATAIPQQRLAEIVREAQSRTGVSVAAVALHEAGRTVFAGAHERSFRIASITKSFTATALSVAGLLDDRRRALLSHTAGYRPERAEQLPPECAGLWSYSNAGYWEAAGGFDGDYSAAVRELVIEPLGLRSTGFETPDDPVLGTLPDDVVADPSYPVERRPSGGLWSRVGDLVEYGLAHCAQWSELHEPVAEALGAHYGLGWWVRDGVLDHEGSVGGYQSLLLLVPERRLVLAVLTNSWRGSALIHRVVKELPLGLTPPSSTAEVEPDDGRYAIEGFEAIVADGSVTEIETDPLTGARFESRYPLRRDAPLMSWRSDFPRPGVARIGWVALPRAEP